MQPLYPYFAIHRGPKMTEEFLKYLYSHAQALNEIQKMNVSLEENSGKIIDLQANNMKENIKLISLAKCNIEAYLKGWEKN